jgi:hypothetical protein
MSLLAFGGTMLFRMCRAYTLGIARIVFTIVGLLMRSALDQAL